MYIIALEAGMLFFIRLAAYRKCYMANPSSDVTADMSKTFKIFRNPKKRSATSSLKAFVDTHCVIPSL